MAKAKDSKKAELDPNSRATVSGPAIPDALEESRDNLTAKMAGTKTLAGHFPFNTTKGAEYGQEPGAEPPVGQSAKPDVPIVGSSTVQEKTGSEKLGSGSPVIGSNKTVGPLDTPSVLFDAVVLPNGTGASKALAADGRVLEFLKDQYRHCKPILVIGGMTLLLDKSGIPVALPSGDADPGLIVANEGDARSAVDKFVNALGKHRHFERETDPPRV